MSDKKTAPEAAEAEFVLEVYASAVYTGMSYLKQSDGSYAPLSMSYATRDKDSRRASYDLAKDNAYLPTSHPEENVGLLMLLIDSDYNVSDPRG